MNSRKSALLVGLVSMLMIPPATRRTSRTRRRIPRSTAKPRQY